MSDGSIEHRISMLEITANQHAKNLTERLDRMVQQIAVIDYMVEQIRDEVWGDPGGVDRRANERVEKLINK